MNVLNEKFASMFRTYGAEQKIEEKKMVRKDSLTTWDTDRFYPPVKYKYSHGLLFNRRDSLITISIRMIPLILLSAWILSKYL